MIKREDIITYCKDFMGYGNLTGDTLIVGMEEGDKKIYHTYDRVHSRIESVVKYLKKHGGQTIDFLESHKQHSPEHYDKIMKDKLFSPYWRIASRVIMRSKNIDIVDNSSIANFFRTHIIKDLAILEFRPLACTDLNTWKYDEWTDMPELRNRETYYEWIDQHRIQTLQNIINDSNFKNVLIFGKSLEKKWASILGVNFSNADVYQYENASIKVLNHNSVNYFLIPQNSKATSNLFFDWVGQQIYKINNQ